MSKDRVIETEKFMSKPRNDGKKLSQDERKKLYAEAHRLLDRMHELLDGITKRFKTKTRSPDWDV